MPAPARAQEPGTPGSRRPDVVGAGCAETAANLINFPADDKEI